MIDYEKTEIKVEVEETSTGHHIDIDACVEEFADETDPEHEGWELSSKVKETEENKILGTRKV